jgi:hypothetical protein
MGKGVLKKALKACQEAKACSSRERIIATVESISARWSVEDFSGVNS